MGQRDRRNLSRTRFSVLFSNFLNFCMSQKAELPSLTGHRTKTRKRDEKKVNDPSGFRDSVIEGLARAGVGGVDLEDGEVQIDLDAVSKFLDTAGNKLDYRRYGEVLLEILIAGGLLAPGGSIQEDGEKGMVQTRACVFQDAVDLERVKAWDQVFIKLMRRYKYLEKMLSEEMKKILVYLRGFSQEHRTRLAQVTGLWVASGLILPNTLVVIINEHQVKDSVALEFMLDVLSVVKTEKEIQRDLRISISDEKPTKEIVMDLKDAVKKNGLLEQEAVAMIWSAVMSACEWNKKEDLVHEQALKHLKNYISLFSAFTSSAKREMVLCNKVQEYCYDNQNFLKCFNKIVLLFYKTEVLSEEVILKWYKDGHVPKGWTVFMEQMKKFIDWLEQAESGLKRQAAGVSLPSLLSCLSPQYTSHPWLQDFGAWVPSGTLYSIQQMAHLGCYDDSKSVDVLEALVKICGEGGASKVFFGRVLGQLSLKIIGRKILSERGIILLSDVWRLGRNGLTDLNVAVCAGILEKCVETFIAELEALIVDSLEMRISDDLCTSLVSDQPTHSMNRLLIRVVSTSRVLFTRSIQIFAKYLLDFDWNYNLIYFYQSFVSSVLNSAPDPIFLYPNTSQSLVSLLLTHRDINKLGMGDQVVKVVRDMFNLKDLDVKMVLLQFPEFVEELQFV